MKRPKPKKDVKIKPIIVRPLSSQSVLHRSNIVVAAASPPEKKAPIANGNPNIYAAATPGTIE